MVVVIKNTLKKLKFNLLKKIKLLWYFKLFFELIKNILYVLYKLIYNVCKLLNIQK